MNIQDAWEKAVKRTEIVRPRIQPLQTFSVTHLPYICLSESSVNPGDTAVRRGEVAVEKPAIVLPFNMPHFEGFKFEEEMRVNEDFVNSFFLVRGISFPSLKYNNKQHSLEIFEGSLSKAAEHFKGELQKAENVHSGLVLGPEDCWQFSVIIFVGGQIMKSAEGDLKRLFDDFRVRLN